MIFLLGTRRVIIWPFSLPIDIIDIINVFFGIIKYMYDLNLASLQLDMWTLVI